MTVTVCSRWELRVDAIVPVARRARVQPVSTGALVRIRQGVPG